MSEESMESDEVVCELEMLVAVHAVGNVMIRDVTQNQLEEDAHEGNDREHYR